MDGLAGLITVEGGNFTTIRNLAENILKTRTVDCLASLYGQNILMDG
jgi:glycerol-3-phosphate dehydrogenase